MLSNYEILNKFSSKRDELTGYKYKKFNIDEFKGLLSAPTEAERESTKSKKKKDPASADKKKFDREKPLSEKYKTFTEFEKNVLKTVKKEINEMTDLWFDYAPARKRGVRKYEYLYYFLNQVRDEYDYILIDTQPTRDSLLLSNAIYAADYILIPAGCEDNSEESAFRLYYECNKMKQSSTSHLMGAGVLLVNVDKSAATDKKIQEHFKEELGTSLFSVAIPTSKTVKTSISRFLPVCYMAKTQPVAKAYVKAYEELKKRLEVK